MHEQPSTPYTDEQWIEIVEGRPLKFLGREDLVLLDRHWLWADSARRWFERKLSEQADDPPASIDQIHEEWSAAMYVWYGLLWSVIEGMTLRRVPLQGGLRDDVRRVREPLGKARNAVFHVGAAYYDARLFEPMQASDSALRIRRAHAGIGNLLLDEIRNRRVS
jgi:hypothetical protein